MNQRARTTSISSIRPQLVRRPSVSSRLSFAVSTAEQGESQIENGQGIAAQHQIEEEIAKIKRYEVGIAHPVRSDSAPSQLLTRRLCARTSPQLVLDPPPRIRAYDRSRSPDYRHDERFIANISVTRLGTGCRS